jgi:enoyl-CoA hydratase/carnithine racemase
MTLAVQRSGHVLKAVLNRPERRNALSSDLCEALGALAAQVERDFTVRCVILTGAGSAFCAGADLKERGGMGAEDRWRYVLRLNEIVAQLDAIPVPVIAAVNGPAMGGGVEIASIADFRFATGDAIFALPEVRWGIIPGGSIVRLVRDVSPALASRLCFTGDPIGAQEAMRYGFVDVVYPSAVALENGASTLAERIAENAPLALRASKKLLRGAKADYSAKAMSLAMELRGPLEDTEDSREGLRAFAEKRAANFKGL